MGTYVDDFSSERLTLARQRRSLKKSELARMIGKNPRTIGEYESDRSAPSLDVLERLAEVLDFPVEFFLTPLRNAMTKGGASFRALSRMTATQQHAALAVGTQGVELNEWIQERFDLPEPDLPDLQPGIIDPEAAAALVRGQWGLGERPIGNVLHLLERHGVRAFSLADEHREVDAFSEWVNGLPYICLATYKTAERAIFDAAHELGHLVLHRDHASPRGRRQEQEADRFASSFLMPRADVLAEAPRHLTLRSLVEAKQRWRVSAAALNYRMHYLGLTSDWHYREMCIELGQFGRREPETIPHERSQLLMKVFNVMRDEGVTRKQIAHQVLMSPDDLDALTFGLSLIAVDGGEEEAPRRRDHLRLV